MKLLRKIPILGCFLTRRDLESYISTNPNAINEIAEKLERDGYTRYDFSGKIILRKGNKRVVLNGCTICV